MILIKLILVCAFIFIGIPYIWGVIPAFFASLFPAGFLLGWVVAAAVMIFVGGAIIGL